MREKNILVDMKLGQEIPPLKVKVERKIYKKYNRLIKEINPMHLSKFYVQKLGYEDVLVAGNFLYSYIPKWIIDWIGAENVNAIKNINVKFENAVYPDEEIILNGSVIDLEKLENNTQMVKCEFHVEKTNGERVFNGNINLMFSD